MKTVHVGFTGTRKGLTDFQRTAIGERMEKWRNRDSHINFHHGDCHGADAQAHDIAIEHQARIYLHPSNLMGQRAFCEPYHILYEQKQPIARNHDIVDACRELIACPKADAEELRSGTWATIRYARKVGRRVILIYPQRIVVENNQR
jgi:hypothetical protein